MPEPKLGFIMLYLLNIRSHESAHSEVMAPQEEEKETPQAGE